MTKVSNERLAEMIAGLSVEAGPKETLGDVTARRLSIASPDELGAILTELLSLRNAQSEAVAWLVEAHGISSLWNVEENAESQAERYGVAVQSHYTHPAPPLAVATAPKTGIEVTGFYRKCSADTPGAEWGEGIGYYIHDEQARIEGQAEAGLTAQPPAVTDEMVDGRKLLGAINKLPRRVIEVHDNNGDVFVSLHKVRAALTAALEAKQ